MVSKSGNSNRSQCTVCTPESLPKGTPLTILTSRTLVTFPPSAPSTSEISQHRPQAPPPRPVQRRPASAPGATQIRPWSHRVEIHHGGGRPTQEVCVCVPLVVTRILLNCFIQQGVPGTVQVWH